MRLRLVLLSILALLASGLPAAPAPAAGGPELPPKRVWERDVRHAMDGARGYLKRRAERGGKLAINLDIDNTSLASEYDEGRAMLPTLRFALKAERLGILVFFNTARPWSSREATRRELERAGYPVDRICLQTVKIDIVQGKQLCRRKLRRDGYTIVANVGNNDTDLRGAGYERAFKLPDYDGLLS